MTLLSMSFRTSVSLRNRWRGRRWEIGKKKRRAEGKEQRTPSPSSLSFFFPNPLMRLAVSVFGRTWVEFLSRSQIYSLC